MATKVPPKTLIFDFDGTLADTLTIAISVFRELAPNGHAADDDEIERLRGLSAREVAKALSIPWWRIPRLVYYGRKAVTMQIDSVKTFPGMPLVLRQLHEQGYRLLILSSNSTKNIAFFLQKNKLEAYFDGFWGDQGIFAKSAALKKLLRKKNLKPEDCRYIGDEARDVESARHAGVRCIAVTWGYNNRRALESAKAEVLIDHPQDLLRVIER